MQLIISLSQESIDSNIVFSRRYNRYGAMWYRTPVQIQKILYMMQIRSGKLCSLTAGGLYEMNIENFGVVCITI